MTMILCDQLYIHLGSPVSYYYTKTQCLYKMNVVAINATQRLQLPILRDGIELKNINKQLSPSKRHPIDDLDFSGSFINIFST